MKAVQTSARIDPEFRALIPSLSVEERAQLEANLVADGCRDPLVVWGSLLLDGHNRFEICQARGLVYQTVQQSCADRDAAKIWIIRNQFGRRNLSAYTRAELALKLEPLIAGQVKANQRQSKGQGKKGPQNSADLKPMETRNEIAKVAGVSHDTIAKAKAIAARAPEPVKEKLRRGETSIHKEYLKLDGRRVARSTARPVPQGSHLNQSLAEARAWMAKWSHIGALAPVFDAITKLLEEAQR